MPSRFYNGLVRSSGTVVVFNLGQTSAGLDIKVYPVQATAAGSIELSLGAGAHKAKFLSAANAGDEFALLASSVSVCEMVRLRERTAFSNIPLPGTASIRSRWREERRQGSILNFMRCRMEVMCFEG